MKNFDRIERFLKNEMSVSEKEAFENEVSNNEALAIEVKLQQSENEALDNLAFEVLKNDIVAAAKKERPNKVETSIKEKPPVNSAKGNKSLPFLIAAALAMLVFLGYMFLKEKEPNVPEQVEQPTSPEQKVPAIKKESPALPDVKEESIEKIPETKKEIPKTPQETASSSNSIYRAIAFAAIPNDFDGNIRGDGSEVDDPQWKQLLKKYHGEEFEEVIALVNEMKSSHLFYNDAIQLKAESLFYLSDFKSAQTLYIELLQNGDNFLKDNYEYELLRCYVAQLPKQKKAFLDFYEKIMANPDHTYYKDIEALILEVKKVLLH